MYRDGYGYGAGAHKETEHYKRWREEVAGLMAVARQVGVRIMYIHIQ
jgi:quinol monooxygenase YgiN